MCDFCKGFVMNVMCYVISLIWVISLFLLVDYLLYFLVLVCIEFWSEVFYNILNFFLIFGFIYI